LPKHLRQQNQTSLYFKNRLSPRQEPKKPASHQQQQPPSSFKKAVLASRRHRLKKLLKTKAKVEKHIIKQKLFDFAVLV